MKYGIWNIAGYDDPCQQALIDAGISPLTAAILASRDRLAAGPTAPPVGLYMTALNYQMEELDGRAD